MNAARTDKGTTSLMYACTKNHLEIAQFLVENGANVNSACTDSGLTALMLASMGGNLECVRFLLASGADKAAQTFDGGFTAISLCPIRYFEPIDAINRAIAIRALLA